MTSDGETLPTQEDFDAIDGPLDAICAWENFGGLNLSDAYLKFCENPLRYNEDFMFMGSGAFFYYFPVLERFVNDSRVGLDGDFEVECIGTLAHCIKLQFEEPCPTVTLSLRHRVEELINHVRKNLSRYCNYAADQQRIDSAWEELQDRISSLRNSGQNPDSGS